MTNPHPLTEVEPWKVFRRLCTPATSWKDEAGWRQRAETFAVAIAAAQPSTEAGLAEELERAADRLSRSTIGSNPMIRDVIRTLRDGRNALRQSPPLPSGERLASPSDFRCGICGMMTSSIEDHPCLNTTKDKSDG